MIRVGLTGGIGSGKSVIARILQVLDVPVYDSDQGARRLMEHDPDLKAAVADLFGASIYPKGVLDRKALAALVFNDPQLLKGLNALVHPAVREDFNRWSEKQNAPYVVMESAILAETGGHAYFDRTIVVTAPEALRVQRVMRRDGVGEEAVLARVRNQAPEEQRIAIADHIITNDDRQLVIPQVLKMHHLILTS